MTNLLNIFSKLRIFKISSSALTFWNTGSTTAYAQYKR